MFSLYFASLSLPDLAEGTTCLKSGDDKDSSRKRFTSAQEYDVSDDDRQFSSRDKEGQSSRGNRRAPHGAQTVRKRRMRR